MSYAVPWGTPFYLGGGSSPDVPSRFHAAIAGRPYMLDTADGPPWVNDDIPSQRAEAFEGEEFGEQSLSTQGLARRTRQSWHLGAGQEWADRPESSPYRFHSSSGVDPWTRNGLRLLNGTVRVLASVNEGLRLAVAAGRLYVTDGAVVRFTEDGATWTAVTGTPALPALSVASDGSTVYVAYGAGGVWAVAAGATAAAQFATGTALATGYAKGRLLVLEGATASPRVYNVTASGAVTAGNLLLTAPGLVVDANQWVAEGPNALYVVGSVGDRSRIWRTAPQPDGTALAVPVTAGVLPDGQTARSAVGYLNSVLLVGTDDRVFVLRVAGEGDVVPTGNLPTAAPVYAFEPQDRFVWHGGHASSTLGRIDLSENADPEEDFAPARASDLAASVPGGDVRSIVTFRDKRVFTVAGQGVFAEADVKAASGSLDLGAIGFGIGDPKNAFYADVRHEPLAPGASVLVEVAADGGPFTVAGTSATAGAVSATVSLGQVLAESFRLRVTLTGDPVLTMLTLRAAPAPPTGEVVSLRLLLWHKVADLAGGTAVYDVPVEREYLRALRAARTAVTVQLGSESFTGRVDRLARFAPHSMAAGDGGGWLGYWNGTLQVDVKRMDT